MAQLGDPFVGNIPKKLSYPELLQALRVDIAGELEAIMGYEAHVQATDDERVKKILTHIANEERRHVGELQQLMMMLDPGQEDYVQQGIKKVQDQQSQNFQTPLQ
ncbi:MAG: demethoxyubiquinone hydroxylase family protein [Syntrophomonadaceae bacterium]